MTPITPLSHTNGRQAADKDEEAHHARRPYPAIPGQLMLPRHGGGHARRRSRLGPGVFLGLSPLTFPYVVSSSPPPAAWLSLSIELCPDESPSHRLTPAP